MNTFTKIKSEELTRNPFTMIGKDWFLVTAEKEGVVNTMTASWGGLGILWFKNVAYIFLRPQRYTKEFVDAGETLSLSVLNDSFREQLSFLGKVSGRDDPDKIKKSGLTVRKADNGTPFFDEAEVVLICKKLFAQEFNPDSILIPEIHEKMYPNKDYHTMYVCEIEEILVR